MPAEPITSREQFEHTYVLRQDRRVEFGEVDMLRHVNNARYVYWAESIRSVYLAEIIGQDIWGSSGMILARHDMSYDAMIKYRDDILVGGRISRMGKKSFDFETCVWHPELDKQAYLATAVLVAFDYQANASIAIPEDWRKRITAYERVSPR
jgi:acyl-CoA thioester hydrolase